MTLPLTGLPGGARHTTSIVDSATQAIDLRELINCYVDITLVGGAGLVGFGTRNTVADLSVSGAVAAAKFTGSGNPTVIPKRVAADQTISRFIRAGAPWLLIRAQSGQTITEVLVNQTSDYLPNGP